MEGAESESLPESKLEETSALSEVENASKVILTLLTSCVSST